MLSHTLISLLGLAATALSQTANINFYDTDDICRSGLFASCTNLPPNSCCALASNQLATCMDFATTTPGGIGTAFSSQGGNQCAVVLERLSSGVCVCPNGFPVISGGSWNTSASRRSMDDKPCETTIQPNAFGWTENESTWMVYNEDEATYTNVADAVANGTAKTDIGKFIREHGQQV
ncbi:uncharacterized protein TRIREDRAFT_103174 [Trichoderma reesei QM6a]|uniref:Predicted protein n=2 Tax=Hypocrea jecorina TaxID=51453 RepID=G0R6V4_HYPJQ|nr:uncharacterized protein TRIREDRAFT_103174 [Trichoderma reesei QM6a]EGR53042.1 predicted protein [Trichoderma reesei QM6a]ETR98540.1 hypothetical protein M419DRAFT_38538 [Trichoderma reesei RUT C-30]